MLCAKKNSVAICSRSNLILPGLLGYYGYNQNIMYYWVFPPMREVKKKVNTLANKSLVHIILTKLF